MDRCLRVQTLAAHLPALPAVLQNRIPLIPLKKFRRGCLSTEDGNRLRGLEHLTYVRNPKANTNKRRSLILGLKAMETIHHERICGETILRPQLGLHH